jgi:hypothetical protein
VGEIDKLGAKQTDSGFTKTAFDPVCIQGLSHQQPSVKSSVSELNWVNAFAKHAEVTVPSLHDCEKDWQENP